MSALGSKGDRYYRAMELSTRLPWFIVTCVLKEDGFEMLHSVCCAWDGDLLTLLEPTAIKTVVSLQHLAPSSDDDGGWEARDVARVWQAVDPAGNRMVILQDMAGDELPDALGSQARQAMSQRTLVFQARQLERKRQRCGPGTYGTSVPRVEVPLYTGTLDPYETVSAAELAVHLGDIGEAEVKRREMAGQLLSVTEGEPPQKRYPIYQALPVISGVGFKELLDALRNSDLPREHDFFKFESPELGLMTPVEALIGGVLTQRGFRDEAAEILAADPQTRHQWVMGAAQAFVADTSGW